MSAHIRDSNVCLVVYLLEVVLTRPDEGSSSHSRYSSAGQNRVPQWSDSESGIRLCVFEHYSLSFHNGMNDVQILNASLLREHNESNASLHRIKYCPLLFNHTYFLACCGLCYVLIMTSHRYVIYANVRSFVPQVSYLGIRLIQICSLPQCIVVLKS